MPGITWANEDGSLNLIDFDAAIGEQHNVSAIVTEHPVANGASIVDHIRPNQDTLSIDVFITDTPVNLDVAPVEKQTFPKFGAEDIRIVNGEFSGKFKRVERTYDQLRKLVRSGVFVDVHTSVRHYKNMLISDLSAPRTAGTGTAVVFTIELRQVRLVSSKEVSVPLPVEVRAKPAKQRGGKNPKQTDEKTGDDASFFSRLTGSGKAI